VVALFSTTLLTKEIVVQETVHRGKYGADARLCKPRKEGVRKETFLKHMKIKNRI